MRIRALVASLGLAGMVGVLIAQPERLDAAEVATGPADPDEGEAAAAVVDAAEALGRPAAAVGQDEVLTGMRGAATALGARDAARAIELGKTVLAGPDAAAGRAAWFVAGATVGRAQMLTGEPEAAIFTLQPRVEHAQLAKFFPPDVLGVELAQAELAYARLPDADATLADARLDAGIARLRKLERREPIRNYAQMQVLQAQMLAAKRDPGSARQAAAALTEVLGHYPHHPERGRMWLDQARALDRAGRTSDAMAQLRTITIERSGEPESSVAWEELATIAARTGKARAPLTDAERLAAATAARRNKRADVSREMLEQLIADPRTPAPIRGQAERSRSYTASKQRDWGTCAADLRKAYAASGNFDVRDDLLKCLERGAFYDEAIALRLSELEGKRGKKKAFRAHVTWEALELAIRGGKYERARELLSRYEKDGKAHGQDRAWLRPWIAQRLGEDAEAIAGFAAYAKKYRSDAKRAQYFLGRMQVRSTDPIIEAAGAQVLRSLAGADALGYYGLQARQRLLDAKLETPAVPTLAPVAEELSPPTRAAAEATLSQLAADYGDGWPSIERARQLYVAGYNDEARRELRVTVQAYLTRGKKAGGPRSEDILVGLGWKANWKYPRVAPTKEGRKTLRDGAAVEALRVGLREVAFAMQEPNAYVRLSTSKDAPFKARWTLRAFRPAVEREARLRKIDPKHMWSLMYTESRFRPHVVSHVGARGALQIMPSTAHQLAERLGETDAGHFFDTDRLFDIDTNAHLSAYYVAELLAKFHGQAPMAYASYNGGPSNVARWLAAKAQSPTPLEMDTFIEEIAFSESYRYTKRVMEVHATYALLYEGDLPRWTNTVDPKFEDNIDF